MKYAILIGDGMSDEPLDALGNKTPLQAAATPNLDSLASAGRLGLFATVPEGFAPGSDVANLSILGYDPAKYYTGRAPLEAASIGVELAPEDVAYRCNLVTIMDVDGREIMHDYSAGHISTKEAAFLISDLDRAARNQGVRFHVGTSYRHLMVWKDGKDGAKTTPPHDISDKETGEGLPQGEGSEKLLSLMALSREVFAAHPVNRNRFMEQKNLATSIWLWGQGRAPRMPGIKERFGLDGAMISAVDLMKGIGVYAGLKVIDVPGATGYLDTNYAGKVEYALNALEDMDLVCIHVEAPDEAGHQGNLEDKLKAIEDFDSKVVGPMLKGLERYEEVAVLALNDHPTPVKLKTHTPDPVPFALYRGPLPLKDGKQGRAFTERCAADTRDLATDCNALATEFFS